MDLKIFRMERQVHHMNLMERNHHTDEEENENREKERDGLQEFLQKPYMTTVLLGVIAVLLICIIALLVWMPRRRQETQADINNNLQQSITDYANEQKQKDYVSGLSGETVSIAPVKKQEDGMQEPDAGTDQVDEQALEDADSGKTAIVVDVEDENDISYSKEFILNEALPYFADNRQDAIWDLAHLKRYVKLSSELKNTNQYYYIGDVNSDGQPNGKGLAIYEDNSYYYGDWVAGVRSGSGTWFRFYISEKSKRNAMGVYTEHSYAGEWADNLPNGEGAEHFDVDISKIDGPDPVIMNVVGGFKGGLYDGEMYANTVDYKSDLLEWDAIAANGVFTLWRDMSAIGECSVWRNKDNHNLCLDIDKSENKNQGIQELLR